MPGTYSVIAGYERPAGVTSYRGRKPVNRNRRIPVRCEHAGPGRKNFRRISWLTAKRRRHACVASGGGFPGGGDERPPRDGRQSPQPVRRQQTPRRYAHERHFRYQTVGPGECEIFAVIVEAGPADIIDETLRRNAAIGQNDLVVLKLHMPPDEARRHVRKRQEADRGSVLRQRAGVDQHVAEQQGVIGGHGQRFASPPRSPASTCRHGS